MLSFHATYHGIGRCSVCGFVTVIFTSALVSKGQISIWYICLVWKLALYKYYIIIIVIIVVVVIIIVIVIIVSSSNSISSSISIIIIIIFTITIIIIDIIVIIIVIIIINFIIIIIVNIIIIVDIIMFIDLLSHGFVFLQSLFTTTYLPDMMFLWYHSEPQLRDILATKPVQLTHMIILTFSLLITVPNYPLVWAECTDISKLEDIALW